MSFDSPQFSIVFQEGNKHKSLFPIRLGVPFSRGTSVSSCKNLQVFSPGDIALQSVVTPIALWNDGTVKWAKVELLIDSFTEVPLFLKQDVNSISCGTISLGLDSTISRCIRVDRGQLVFPRGVRSSLTSNIDGDSSSELIVAVEISGAWGSTLVDFTCNDQGAGFTKDALGVEYNANATFTVPSLPLPIELQLRGKYWVTGQIDFVCAVTNPNPADHPGGNWDLGNKGSFYFHDLTLKLTLQGDSGRSDLVVRESFDGDLKTARDSIELFQASSGGQNWNSSNHIDRNRKVPMSFRGYRISLDGRESTAERAKPYVAVESDGITLAVACNRFWQNFPIAVRANGKKIEVGLMPKESGYEHELQGGEQKTFEFAAYLGDAPAASLPLDGYLSDPYAVIDREFLESTGVVDEKSLGPLRDSPGVLYEQLVRQAIEGPDSFFVKREKIDEYGWRHYGDVYGDHEAVYHKGATPMVSHYNNQYDCVQGFFYQFMRTGDPRWYEQMIAMANHAWDIDTYHTNQDKLLYNGGLFWHTYHYADADTGTHRSYPRSLLQENHFESGKDLDSLGKTGAKLKKVYGKGGGPAASQNYSTGWMYAYYLTGDSRYRQAAINAADYVIHIEDGSKTPFRWLSNHSTGYSTCSSHDYHGPGRASANSTLALLTGYELTADRKYLDMAIALMRRTVHPEQNLDRLDLLNAELRWFYTMYLQALCRLIDVLAPQQNQRDDLLYAVASLMHYARWMLKHERPILDTPEKLQYPTETWAAQDIRKWHVLAYAAKWAASDEERYALMDRAEFFFTYCMNTLESFSTKSLCRPVVLLLNYGWQRTGLQNASRIGYPVPPDHRFGEFQAFVPQKTIAVGRAKKILMAAALVFCMTLAGGIVYLLRS
jgi:hypothetical protein